MGIEMASTQELLARCATFERRGPTVGALIQIKSGVADVIQAAANWSPEIAKRITVDNRRCGMSDFVQPARAVMQKVLDRLDSASEAPAPSAKGPKLG